MVQNKGIRLAAWSRDGSAMRGGFVPSPRDAWKGARSRTSDESRGRVCEFRVCEFMV